MTTSRARTDRREESLGKRDAKNKMEGPRDKLKGTLGTGYLWGPRFPSSGSWTSLGIASSDCTYVEVLVRSYLHNSVRHA